MFWGVFGGIFVGRLVVFWNHFRGILDVFFQGKDKGKAIRKNVCINIFFKICFYKLVILFIGLCGYPSF